MATMERPTPGNRGSPSSVAIRQHETPRRKGPKSGRRGISKSPRFRVRKSPVKAGKQLKIQVEAEDDEASPGDDWPIDDVLREEMKLEKRNHPWHSSWAKDEERMFEIMFLRQELPILPHHWEVDFRGVPISDTSFSTSDGMKPLVYAHLKEFRATMALTRLIDLTANVRTACQSGLRRKAPGMIKKGLDSYLSWAAEDGGYSHLRVVANIVVEVIDTHRERVNIPTIIESRMRELARLQREYLNCEAGEEKEESGKTETETEHKPQSTDNAPTERGSSWMTLGSRLISRLFTLIDRRPVIKREPSEEEPAPEDDGEVTVKMEEDDSSENQRAASSTQKPSPRDTTIKDEESQDEDTPMTDIPSVPSTPEAQAKKAQLHTPKTQPQTATPPHHDSPRTPPVVYGLFVINTSVFLLTVDSSKPESSSHISFHVEVEFQEHMQSVWNALTVAIVVCLARDEMMTRLGDFEELEALEESDPDA